MPHLDNNPKLNLSAPNSSLPDRRGFLSVIAVATIGATLGLVGCSKELLSSPAKEDFDATLKALQEGKLNIRESKFNGDHLVIVFTDRRDQKIYAEVATDVKAVRSILNIPMLGLYGEGNSLTYGIATLEKLVPGLMAGTNNPVSTHPYAELLKRTKDYHPAVLENLDFNLKMELSLQPSHSHSNSVATQINSKTYAELLSERTHNLVYRLVNLMTMSSHRCTTAGLIIEAAGCDKSLGENSVQNQLSKRKVSYIVIDPKTTSGK